MSSVDPDEVSRVRANATFSDEAEWEDILDDDEVEYDERSVPGQRNAERLLRLFHLLNTNICTPEQILARLQDHYPSDLEDDGSIRETRNFYWQLRRDLLFLRKIGYEIKKKVAPDKTTRYRLRAGSGPISSLLFTDQELAVLAMLYTFLLNPNEQHEINGKQPLSAHTWSHPFGQEVLGLIERLTEGLSPQQRKAFEQRIRKPLLYLNAETVTDYVLHRDTLAQIMQAITRRQRLLFEYSSSPLAQSVTIHRQVDPYYLIQQDGHIYLVGFSHDPGSAYKNRIFEWRVDRIKGESIKLQPQTIDSVPRKPQLITFHYWADITIAKGGLSRRWVSHEVEREEITGQGRRRLLIRAQATSEWRILQQLHKYGDKVELVDPPELRKKMMEEVKRMHNLYFNQGEDHPN